MSRSIAYHGQQKCQHDTCDNGAYYRVGRSLLCGVHSRKHSGTRTSLPKAPREVLKRLQDAKHAAHAHSVESRAAQNALDGKPGTVSCFKMRMLKQVPVSNGIVNIMPNYRSEGRKDGRAMPSLSPMRMGPIEHGQPHVPPAKNLENFWQGSKVFADEFCEAEGGIVKRNFFDTQRQMFLDETPHRHKRKHEKPLFWLWINKFHNERRLTYIEARQFYCNYYEHFASRNPEFLRLKQMLRDGTDLRICGFDAYEPTRDLESHYLDASRPFGHELVLYTMLVLPPEQYPWRKHKTEEF